MSKFKVGDKVRCINTDGVYYLTVGDVYKVLGCCDGWALIKDDEGNQTYFKGTRFELVQDTPEKSTLASYSLEEVKRWVEVKEKELAERFTYTDQDEYEQTVSIDEDGDLCCCTRPENLRQLITALTNFADDNKL